METCEEIFFSNVKFQLNIFLHFSLMYIFEKNSFFLFHYFSYIGITSTRRISRGVIYIINKKNLQLVTLFFLFSLEMLAKIDLNKFKKNFLVL